MLLLLLLLATDVHTTFFDVIHLSPESYLMRASVYVGFMWVIIKGIKN
jgi:hypothetical protein